MKGKLAKEKQNFLKQLAKLESKKDRGKLSSTSTEKENIKISRQQIKINKLEEDLEKAEKKLNKAKD